MGVYEEAEAIKDDMRIGGETVDVNRLTEDRR